MERSLGTRTEYVDYDRGYLFLTSAYGPMIRILQVASGQFLHDVYMEDVRSYTSCKVNSKYVLIRSNDKFYIYDLESIKATEDVQPYLLLCVMRPLTQRHLMDEDEILRSYHCLSCRSCDRASSYNHRYKFEVIDVASIDSLKRLLPKFSLFHSTS